MPGQYPNIKQDAVPDQLLAGTVLRALGQSADVAIREIKVDATAGLVRLTGFVESLSDKRIAGQIAAATEGAERIENNLVIAPTRPLNDHELFEELDRVLGGYPDWDTAAVGVREVCGGIAYIAGSVTSIEERRTAGRIAARVPGVKQVVNEIDIELGEPIDDVTIATLVSDAVSDDPRIDPFDIHINVEDGCVRLDGEVEDADALRAATERASAVPGVKSVSNRLSARTH